MESKRSNTISVVILYLLVMFSSSVVKGQNDCEESATIVNRKRPCKGTEVFNELFDGPLSEDKWEYTVKLAEGPDYQFVVYNSSATNIIVADGRLKITPTILDDDFVRSGYINFDSRCTSEERTTECGRRAESYLILPPVASARITTRKSFSFRYGSINIRAKFPAGDWIVPELWLVSKNNKYGPGYRSGRIRIAMARGNRALTCMRGLDMGAKRLESVVMVGTDDQNVKAISLDVIKDEEWSKKFHNYTLIWTRDQLTFLVDGGDERTVTVPQGKTLVGAMGFSEQESRTWESRFKLAPFNDQFYISVGVSVGGCHDFPDSCVNKPWVNFEAKQMLNFWRTKHIWYSTWSQPIMEVEHVKVTAL